MTEPTPAPAGPESPIPGDLAQRDTPTAAEAAPRPSVIHTQIAEALRRWHGGNTVVCEHTQIVSYGAAADAVMAVPMIRGMWVRLKLTQFHLGAAKAKVEQLTKERDLAIAHDRQPYPTVWAYDQACKALEAQRQRAERAEAERNALKAELNRLRQQIDDDEVDLDAVMASLDRPTDTTGETR